MLMLLGYVVCDTGDALFVRLTSDGGDPTKDVFAGMIQGE